MTSNIRRTLDEMLIRGVEMPDVAGLHDQHDDPVDARYDHVERERRPHVPVLAPYGMAVVVMFAVCWSIEGVKDGCDYDKKP
jgi:hypothetical protein